MTQGTTHPPGPKGHFWLGSLPEFRRDVLGFLGRCARDYGPVAGFRLAHLRCCLINDPELIGQVLQPKTDSLVKSWDYRQLKTFLGNGLLTSDGDSWRRQRKLIQPAFHRDHMSRYAEVMADETTAMLATWRDGEVRDIHADVMGLTQKIVGQALLGADVSDDAAGVSEALDAIMHEFETMLTSGVPMVLPIPTPARRRLKLTLERLDGIVFRIIKMRREARAEPENILDALLAMQTTSGDGRMSDQQIRDEVMTLFFAGHETVALALTWALYLLAQHPQAASALREEVHAELKDRAPAAADAGRLSYTRRVVQEAMRLYPPAWGIGREVIHEIRLGGYSLKPGTQIFMLQYLMHRDARYFEEPERFLPERWSDAMEQALPKYAYFPFGGGPRFCLGAGFALLEATVLLAMIMRDYSVEPVPDHAVEPQPSITLRPRGGVRLVLRRRA